MTFRVAVPVQIKGLPVYGVAIPTVSGLRNVLSAMGAESGERRGTGRLVRNPKPCVFCMKCFFEVVLAIDISDFSLILACAQWSTRKPLGPGLSPSPPPIPRPSPPPSPVSSPASFWGGVFLPPSPSQSLPSPLSSLHAGKLLGRGLSPSLPLPILTLPPLHPGKLLGLGLSPSLPLPILPFQAQTLLAELSVRMVGHLHLTGTEAT